MADKVGAQAPLLRSLLCVKMRTGTGSDSSPAVGMMSVSALSGAASWHAGAPEVEASAASSLAALATSSASSAAAATGA